ncbi:MAG TPA: hypothetical protein VFS43_37475 [Polyangiaceae bacterium]|nr:hypothetical protein [Polyangiaceae bacterium]
MARPPALDLVSMPRLPASTAVAMGTELLAKADAREALPPGLDKARGRLEEALERLRASRSVLEDAPVIDAVAVAEADHDLDTTWSALHSFLQGWAKLPGKDEERGAAQVLLDAVFPNGLKFTQLTFKLEWAESQARLERLEEEYYTGLLKKLGGVPFLEELREVQQAYGEALMITSPPGPPKSARTHEHAPLQEFVEALRLYVVQASAHAETGEGDAQAFVNDLLAPFTTWLSSVRARRAKDKKPGGTPPPAGPGGDEPPDEVG